jgi:hypothetical protein
LGDFVITRGGLGRGGGGEGGHGGTVAETAVRMNSFRARRGFSSGECGEKQRRLAVDASSTTDGSTSVTRVVGMAGGCVCLLRQVHEFRRNFREAGGFAGAGIGH